MALKRSEIDLTLRHLATVVRHHVSQALEPLIREVAELKTRETAHLARIAALETRAPEKGEPGNDGAPGKDGRDGIDGKDGKDGAPGIDGKEGAPGRDGVNGADGKDGTPGHDGKDGAKGDTGERGLQGEAGRDGQTGRDGRDGAQGNPGRDGIDGKDGRDGVDGKDGAPGINGKDGLGFDDMTVEHEDGGRVVLYRFVCGERSKEFRCITDTVLDRGVFKEGDTYERGDMVSWAGSGWVCQKETKAKPGDGSSEWRLFVKKGRDGKDGVMKPPPTNAPIKLGGKQ